MSRNLDLNQPLQEGDVVRWIKTPDKLYVVVVSISEEKVRIVGLGHKELLLVPPDELGQVNFQPAVDLYTQKTRALLFNSEGNVIKSYIQGLDVSDIDKKPSARIYGIGGRRLYHQQYSDLHGTINISSFEVVQRKPTPPKTKRPRRKLNL